MPVYRIEVRAVHAADDPSGAGVLGEIRQLGINEVADVRSSRVFLLQGPAEVLTSENLERIAREVLIDPVTETFGIGAEPSHAAEGAKSIEVHLKPGVMDPVAGSCEMAIGDLLGNQEAPPPGSKNQEGGGLVQVRTGRKYTLVGHVGEDLLRVIAKRLLVNESIETGYFEAFTPGEFPSGHPYVFTLTHVAIRALGDEQLMELSRKGHLFLDLREMQAIQNYFRSIERDPTDAELETLAQTWSEHCVHKTLKATVEFTEKQEAGSKNQEEPVIIDNLVKQTVFKATMDLNKPWTISVFKDNAGVIEFDDETAVCMKVETHNRPSAIEPYGGAATGIGGCIRDVMGTGLGAKPFANTDIFCFADPETAVESLPNGVIHPRRSMQRVVAGVRDYGNRMGIPTVNGALFFDQRYVGNPLVFCGTVGVMPRKFADKGSAKPGDHIVVIGGRTGRDGIHGATFSSDVVTNTHADEFSHAVQIGNAITEKKMLDVILQARDQAEGPLFHAITDCGAGGLSSAIGEMGEKVGATVELHTVPLKYEGLSYAEIWISEAQERMVLAVPAEKVQTLLDLCASEDVEGTDIGVFDGSGKLTLHFHEHTVAQMDMAFIHDGIPKPTRKAVWTKPERVEPHVSAPKDFAAEVHGLLAMPTIASKHWIIRQYDHEVQGGTVIKPLVGVNRDGPGDASVVRPVLDSKKGVALANGCQPRFGDIDPYQMTLNGMDEAVRNIVCVGGDPERTAILDNFCWPKCSDPQNLGALVKACQACYDGAMAYGTPFVSGKDSLSNEFITDKGERIQIPYTLLISAMSIVADVSKCVTMDAKKAGNHLVLVGLTKRELGGSHWYARHGFVGSSVPVVDLKGAGGRPATARAVSGLIRGGAVAAAHDLSEGGLAVALSEMLFAGNLGASVDLAGVARSEDVTDDSTILFSESASRYLLEIEPGRFDAVARTLKEAGIRFGVIGSVTEGANLKVRSIKGGALMEEPVGALKKSWLGTLDW